MTPLVGSVTAGGIPGSGIRRIADLAWRVPGALRLELGEPADPTPPHVLEAAAQAMRDGGTRYGPSAGLPVLREALVAKLSRVNGVTADPRDVLVSAGGVEGLAAVYRSVLDAGDEILVPDPGWPNLASLALVCGAVPVRYGLLRDGRAVPDVAELDRLTGPRTRALVLNSPSNPTGAVIPRETVEALLTWAAERGLVVVSDDCYDEMWLDAPVACTARVAADAAARGLPMPPVVSVFSFSKTHAMTGFRLGYVVCPPELTPRVHRVQETVLSCPSTPVQHAGLAAVNGPQDHVDRMRTSYRQRRDAALAQLAGSPGGVAVETPAEGAFYLWMRQSSGRPSAELAEELLLQHGVALAPGTAFGPAGEAHLRVSLAASTEVVLEGLRRVAEALD